MVRLYAKTMLEGKMTKHYKCAFREDFQIDHFEFYIKSICTTWTLFAFISPLTGII